MSPNMFTPGIDREDLVKTILERNYSRQVRKLPLITISLDYQFVSRFFLDDAYFGRRERKE